MAKISIVHTTEYIYRNPVGLLRHKLMVRPDESHDLRLHSATLKVEPEPTGVYWKHDVFNNSICYLEWPEALRTTAQHRIDARYEHHPDGQPLPVYSLDELPSCFHFPTTPMRFPISRACRTPDAGPRPKGRRLGPPCRVRCKQQTDPKGAGSDDARDQGGVPL